MSRPKSSTALPKNWPREITFLPTLDIPPPLSACVLQTPLPPPFCSPNSSVPIIPIPSTTSPNRLVRITPITNPTHPAYNQHGLFAGRPLARSSFIILYLGTLHSSRTTNQNSNYDLSLDRDLDLSIDASQRGNEARFINDFRGIRPEGPNAEFRDCLLEVAKGVYERRIGVFVLSAGRCSGRRSKGITKGEEIVVSYGKGFWKAREEGEDGGGGGDEGRGGLEEGKPERR